jgi:OCT family organic cation transporter-like MFS transporter 4/5
MFVITRFFVGGSIHAVWSSFFILMAEMIPSSGRSFSGGVLNFGWNFGSLLMTLLAFFLRTWQHLQLAFAVVSLTLISYFFLIPESPRWLLG